MKIENLFEQISSLDSFDEKSGILANAVISGLASPINDATLMCGLIYWFNEGVIRSLVNDDSIVKEATDTILHLPFVEVKGNGFVFHESVRRGLRSVYEKRPEQTIKAYSTALPELLNSMEDDMAAITATYGLIATNSSRADDTISSLLERFTRSHQLNKLKIFAQDMQEVLWLAHDDTLSDKRWVQIGWLQLSNTKFDDALSSCVRALRVNSSNEDAFLLRATVNELLGDFDTALNNLNETIAKFPKSITAYLARAGLYILREEYSHASLDYYKALEIDSKSGFAYVGLAKIFKQKGNKSKQLSLYKKAIDLEPENIWIYLERGTVFSDYKQFDEAISDFNKVLELNSSIDFALIGRATVYEQQEKYDLALADLQKALAISPENLLAIYKMSKIYSSLGKYDDALKSLQEVLSLNPEFHLAYESLWIVFEKLGDVQQAREYFLKALELPQKNWAYYDGLVDIARKHKEFGLAILAAQKGLEVDPKYHGLHLALGFLYLLTGELDLAEIYLNKAIVFKEKKSYEDDLYINLGILRWLKGNKHASQQLFEKVVILLTERQKHLTRSKDQISDLVDLGWANIALGRTKTGMAQIKKYLESDSSDEGGLLDLRDWTSMITKLPDSPKEFVELQSMIDDKILE